MYKSFIKRLIDILVSFTGFIILSPIFIVIFLILYIINKGEPLFFQKRPGKDEKIFKIIKFRTMNNKIDSSGLLLSDALRLTAFGKFLRKTSLDELPQLINVLRGNMSLIGPRPLLPDYLDRYTEEQKKRHVVRPGITGWAQVQGRNLTKFSKRLENDVYYVNNLSFAFDVKIFFMTLNTVLFKKRSIVSGQTMDEVDDIGLGKNLNINHFNNKNEYKR